MNITLVTTSFNDEVHATFNDKRTGCGINLLKPENATRFRRGGRMTDLGELTCAKCKTKIAREMIKSDEKEMKAILKEERMRAKRGMADEGIIPLGNTTAKITAPQTPPPPAPVQPTPAAPPPPAPVVEAPKPAYQPNGAPALNDDLAQFAINKPADEIQETQNSAPQPAVHEPQPETVPVDDFLAQFAINKPVDEPQTAEAEEETDFLAQFAAVSEPKQEAAPAPAAPPVIDDISDALSAMENTLYGTAPAPVQPAPQPEVTETTYEEDSHDYSNDWDTLANQLFTGGVPADSSIKAPVLDDIGSGDYPAPRTAPKEVTAPVLDDIGGNNYPAPAPAPAVQSGAPVQPASIFDVPTAAPEAPAPVQPAPAPAVEKIAEPVAEKASDDSIFDDISAALSALNIPAPTQQTVVDSDPIFDDYDDDDDDLEYIAPEYEPKSPVINDISDALTAMSVPSAQKAEPAPAASAPAQAAAPVLDDISAAISALNVQPAPAPVQPAPVPVQPAPAPVQSAPAPATPAPAPVPVQTAAPNPAAPAGAVGQVISVPQITGYDSLNQPIYAYIQMQIQGYDQNGQPVLVPLPGQNIPVPTATTFSQRFNQNTRLRDAIAAAQEVPTSTRDMTPGQRIAAAEAAKGAPVSANVSKIATNPHTKATSQAFISAISVSKEYANQSLTETQGLQQRTSVLDSVEDVLSQLGDNSLKEKKKAEAKAQMNIPVCDEYKAPINNSYSRPSAPRPAAPVREERLLTKAELKNQKKLEKINAKFQKDMAKRK